MIIIISESFFKMINKNDIIERLGLDPDIIERDLNACYASAKYYNEMKQQNNNNQAFAATLLRRAASHALLVEQDKDKCGRIFLDAARAYHDLNMPYSYMLLVFVQHTRVDFFADDYFFRNQPDIENINDILQRTYLLIASTNRQWNGEWSNNIPKLQEGLEPYRQKPIGILGLPIGNYIDLFVSLREHATQETLKRSNEPDSSQWLSIRRAMQPFLSAYDRSLQQIQQDNYHWKRLTMPFHPAEIDILSVMLYVHKSMRVKGDEMTIKDFINSQLLSEDARFLLNEILKDYI